MASSRSFTALVLIFSLVLVHINEAYQMMDESETPSLSPPPPPSSPLTPSPPTSPVGAIDCAVACAGRCKESKRPNLCKRACGTCCKRCKCVPPGTYGNYDACPCYAKLTTHHNKRKCP